MEIVEFSTQIEDFKTCLIKWQLINKFIKNEDTRPI